MKKILALFTLCAMLLFSLFATGCANVKDLANNLSSMNSASSSSTSTNEKITIEMLDIGQGDATLIRTKDQVIMIDTGDVDQRDNLVKQLKDRNIKTIDKLIITHPHADHLGGAYALFKNFTVKSVYDNGDQTTTNTYKTYLKNIQQQNIDYHQLMAGDEIDFGSGVKFKVFSPTKEMLQNDSDLNDNSLAGQLRYNNFTMMFTGDIEKKAEGKMVSAYGDELKSLILKSPHHGSRTSSSDAFLKALQAKDVLISCGVNNDYGHPHEEALKRYQKYNMNVYRTDKMGTITITSDGSANYTITTEK